jgi:hypothetical protein
MQNVSPSSRWHSRLSELFDEFKEIPLFAMGLPKDWYEDKFWAVSKQGSKK